jgi:hypothetical protein
MGLSLATSACGRHRELRRRRLRRYCGRVREDGGLDLDAALKQFERVAANLDKAERVWAELAGGALTAEAHDNLVRHFVDLTAALPGIDGFRVESVPMSLTEMQLARFDASEVGEPSFHVQVEEQIGAPGAELAAYRHSFNRARREIVRDRMIDLVKSVDALIAEMRVHRAAGEPKSGEHWSALEPQIAELERLLGDSTLRPSRWSDLRRHLSFWEDVDLNDILDKDWPSVQADLDRFLYEELEPMPVDVDDLGALVRARPSGSVTTGLDWSRLESGSFERLLFQLVSSETGYENANWLMKTSAADQGRDIEVQRVTVDGLSGTRRERVIVQCKHWQSRTVGRDDLVLCLEAVQLWDPPPVDLLIVATSGRFSKDAVAWREKRDLERKVPRLELWPDSHLEMLLTRRPHLVASFGLREDERKDARGAR